MTPRDHRLTPIQRQHQQRCRVPGTTCACRKATPGRLGADQVGREAPSWKQKALSIFIKRRLKTSSACGVKTDCRGKRLLQLSRPGEGSLFCRGGSGQRQVEGVEERLGWWDRMADYSIHARGTWQRHK